MGAISRNGQAQPRVLGDGESVVAWALNVLLNPGCFASARATARFAFDMLARQRGGVLFEADGSVQWPAMRPESMGLARMEIERWLAVGIPPPIPARMHASSLLEAVSPPRLRETELLGLSVFDPHKHDVRLAAGKQDCVGKARRRGRAAASGGCGLQPGGDVSAGRPLGHLDVQLGVSIFDPFVLDVRERGFVV